MDITKSITQFTVVHHQKAWHFHGNYSYMFEHLEEEKVKCSTKHCLRTTIHVESAVERISAKTSSNQLKTSVGRWQLAAGNTVQSTGRSLDGMTTASSLLVCPSSQAV